jgi:uncharacterized protein (DUF427 family)
MAKAIWNGIILAESDQTEIVEGNHYFPPDSLNLEYFEETQTQTTCPWKGVANYFTIKVNGNSNPDAAWVYKTPKDAAKNITGYAAFWRGVKVID